MGYKTQGQGQHSLVVMTNKDTYYIDQDTATLLRTLLQQDDRPPFARFTDARSGSGITVALAQVSSLVIPGGDGE